MDERVSRGICFIIVMAIIKSCQSSHYQSNNTQYYIPSAPSQEEQYRQRKMEEYNRGPGNPSTW